MYKLNKIRAHIKLQQLQELKLTRYLEQENRNTFPDTERVKDINRALKRVTENIKMWESKLQAFENAPPREPTRPAIYDGPDKPLIG